MQALTKISCTVTLLLLSFSLNGMPGNDTVRYELLMSSQMLKSVNLAPDFIPSLDISPERHVLLSSKTQFYLLGWGGMTPLGKSATSGTIRSFAFSSDSLLMVIKNDEVCYFDAKGVLTRLLKLPGSEMGICAGKDVMYVYDRSTTKTNKAVYVVSPGGKYAVLLEVTSPITSAVELNNMLLFSSGNMVVQFDMKTKEYKILASLSKEKTVQSLTVDSSHNRIYFATDRAIYAVNDTSAITISDGIGGILKYFDDGLLIFDPAKRFLLRITGIEEELKKPKTEKPVISQQSEPGLLKNQNIIDLVKSGLSEALIISIIKRSKAEFDLSIDAMIKISGEGVSSAIIMEMRQAMKRQASQTQIK